MSLQAVMLLLLLPLPLAFALDLLLGDPVWLYHPVRAIGRCIVACEALLRRAFSPTRGGELAAGVLLAVLLPVGFLAASGVALLLLWQYLPIAWFAVETLLCYQLLAARDLRDESMAVYHKLQAEDLPGAREAVSRIVGRDTAALDAQGVAKAAVETVAENTSDGVCAPLLYMALGGAPLALWYKAVNTLDSMVGYKNKKYRYFGRASARLDDAANYLPARLSAFFMILCTDVAGYDRAGALRVYRRDRRNHASPNSAHTEAVCAGALGVQLGGDASYFGQLHHKPTIGDATRPVAAEDIPRANKLMLFSAIICLMVGLALRLLLLHTLL